MKKVLKIKIFLLVLLLLSTPVYANIGDMGFWGGVSQGRPLPKTTEVLLQQASGKTQKSNSQVMVYKQVYFLDGKPVEFEGLLTSTVNGIIDPNLTMGSFSHIINVNNSDTTANGLSVAVNMTFNVNYRKEGSQTILDYAVRTWRESIRLNDTIYNLDPRQSKMSVSIIKDNKPGVSFYKGEMTQLATYTSGAGPDAKKTVLDLSGIFYGYENPWSQAEAQRINGTVTKDDWQMQYQVRPSLYVNKLLQYSENEPTAISFDGNYREVTQNLSGLSYDIYVKPLVLEDIEDSGNVNIATYNSFEQLMAPDLSYLKGHYAEEDIKKLFSMKILEGEPSYYQPDQAITRGQFIAALTKALKIPIEPIVTTTGRNVPTKKVAFPDVQPERPEYPYIMAAFSAGLVLGRENGFFYPDSTIERQEAVSFLIRALGLENLGLYPTPITPFTDDSSIGTWAKRELYAADRIGLIYPDQEGRVHPTTLLSKAESAALINRLIQYMRTELLADYSEHIVNYPD